MAEEIVIFDIDGTLADLSKRRHHIEKRPKNWKCGVQRARSACSVRRVNSGKAIAGLKK